MAQTRNQGRRALFLTSAVLAAFSAGVAAAENDAADGEQVVVVGSRPNYGEDDTSSATRTDTPLRDVPQAITVITDDLIEDQAMRSMADVVRYVPGASMGQGEGHRDAPTLRGNSSTADFFVDGVRDDVQYFRDLYNAERVEVLKGPNAMIFGRGGGGGVINRVTAWADWSGGRELALTVGAYEQYRGTLDVGGALSEAAALRFNGMYEQSDSYRDFVELERWGVNPTAAFRLSENTTLRAGYEHFVDERTVDRGVPSQNGRPWDGSRSAFFGNPDESFAEADVGLFTVRVDHAFGPNLRLRNHTLYGDYDKYYRNIHPNSAVNLAGNVALNAYDSSMARQNLFNQTDLIWTTSTGAIEHAILAGLEFGRQDTDNYRMANTPAGSVNVANPTTFAPFVFGAPVQSDNRVILDLGAVYVQDQIRLNDQWQIIAGLRFDRFDLEFDNHLGADFSRVDEMVSPRLGVIYRPIEPLSFYASYSISFLPQSGDQFSSLSLTSSMLDPEEFENIELGLKWDVLPELTLTAAVYQLDRSNTPHMPSPGVTVLTGEQRSKGFELGIAGRVTDAWEIMGGYAYQESEITSATSVPAGRVAPLTPEHTFSLWNMWHATPRFSFGVGVTHQSETFASISNAVTLPEFTRVDAALIYAITDQVEAQLNLENVLDEEYWGTAHNDNNITPGSPTAARLTLRARF